MSYQKSLSGAHTKKAVLALCMQGMCEQRLGNAEAAESCYKDSLCFLDKSPVLSTQVCRSFIALPLQQSEHCSAFPKPQQTKGSTKLQATSNAFADSFDMEFGHAIEPHSVWAASMADASFYRGYYHCGDAQVAHAQAVSHNKLGDLHYSRGDLSGARASYRQALDIREHARNEAQQKGAIYLTSCPVNRLCKGTNVSNILNSCRIGVPVIARLEQRSF